MKSYPFRSVIPRLAHAFLLMTLFPWHGMALTQPEDIIARVGDQTITFSEINTMMNSSAIVGLSMPALGTPERDTVRITLLDKMISANLIYLDAIRKGADKAPAYLQAIENHSAALLASLYRKQVLAGEVEVTDDEIQAFYKSSIVPGTELTEEVRVAIEARLRNQKLQQSQTALRDRLRTGVEVVIHEQAQDPDADEVRDDSEPVATIDGTVLTWGEVKGALGSPLNAGSMGNRLEALNGIIDNEILIIKSRAAGLEQDPVYQARMKEYRKTHLINHHRQQLVAGMEPTQAEIRRYFGKNSDRITLKEMRKVQMVVLKTRVEAEALKKRIDSGELTMFRAAADYSIVPDAKQTLGEIGWVRQGSGFPELDAVTFSTGPDQIGGPVESPAGWHLVRVLDVHDAALDDIGDPKTIQATRRMIIDERLDAYVIGLRENTFTVEVYQDTLNRLAQQEADWYAKKAETDTVPPEKIKAQIEKLMK